MTDPDEPLDQLAQRIRDVLAEGETAEGGVDVEVTVDAVVLRGVVNTDAQRASVAAAAAENAGGRAVHDAELVVVGGEPEVRPEVLS